MAKNSERRWQNTLISKKTTDPPQPSLKGRESVVFSPFTGELEGVCSAALSGGGEYADIFLEDTRISSMVLQDGAVSQAQQVCIYGAGIFRLFILISTIVPVYYPKDIFANSGAFPHLYVMVAYRPVRALKMAISMPTSTVVEMK